MKKRDREKKEQEKNGKIENVLWCPNFIIVDEVAQKFLWFSWQLTSDNLVITGRYG